MKLLRKILNQVLSFLDLPKIELTNYQIIRKGKYHSQINVKTRKKLIEYFKPHNEMLYRLLGRNFQWN